jgi:hypothetical protein
MPFPPKSSGALVTCSLVTIVISAPLIDDIFSKVVTVQWRVTVPLEQWLSHRP